MLLISRSDSATFFYTVALVSLTALFLLASLTLIPIYRPSKQAEATIGTAATSTLTFSSMNPMAFVNLLVSSSTGTFATSGAGEKAEFNISTDNYTGYTVSLNSTTTNTNLTKTTSSNTFNISTISAPTTLATFSSSGASGQALNNKWGFIPNYYNATNNSTVNTTTYYPSPTSSAPVVLNTTTAANGSTTHPAASDNYTIGLGLRADYSSPAGIYINDSFIIELVANLITYSISYTDNTGDSSISGMPSAPTAGSTSQTSVTLSNNIPTRTGYTFKSWCLGMVSNNGTTCTGTEFNSGASFGIDQTANNANTALYATWTASTYDLIITADAHTESFSVKVGSTSGTSITCTKSSTTFTCSDLTYGVNYYLYPTFSTNYSFGGYQKTDSAPNSALSDTDDEHAYYTMGAGDGAITVTSKGGRLYMWDAIASDCGSTMYDNRDGTERAYTTDTINNLCWMTTNLALGKSTTTQLTSATTNISGTHTLPASSTAGFSNVSTEYVYNSGSTTCGSNSPCYGYYSWKAAVAGSTGGEDICPKNWRLPTRAEFNSLKSSYNSATALLGSPFLAVYAGYYTSNGLSSGGGASRYWSSTQQNNNSSYGLQFSTSSTTPSVTTSRAYYGYAVRCVASLPSS